MTHSHPHAVPDLDHLHLAVRGLSFAYAAHTQDRAAVARRGDLLGVDCDIALVHAMLLVEQVLDQTLNEDQVATIWWLCWPPTVYGTGVLAATQMRLDRLLALTLAADQEEGLPQGTWLRRVRDVARAAYRHAISASGSGSTREAPA